jgi:hypothetical protein
MEAARTIKWTSTLAAVGLLRQLPANTKEVFMLLWQLIIPTITRLFTMSTTTVRRTFTINTQNNTLCWASVGMSPAAAHPVTVIRNAKNLSTVDMGTDMTVNVPQASKSGLGVTRLPEAAATAAPFSGCTVRIWREDDTTGLGEEAQLLIGALAGSVNHRQRLARPGVHFRAPGSDARWRPDPAPESDARIVHIGARIIHGNAYPNTGGELKAA